MKRLFNKKEKVKATTTPIYVELDAHNWATKMEMRSLISGKSDLKPRGGDLYAGGV